ncbi:MAG: DEAD/DEAH box helicase family protein, partial [Promicromonosporaceae bacterium]|nr:DEAD/DEAH box helicase family protein [Promicromonosporaceae bacterium]
ERLLQRRGAAGLDNAALLSRAPINNEIVNRPYQLRAIRAVDKVFDDRQRAALLVMATGTGKTRVAVALVDQLMKAGWVKRVLFLADRTALVRQAVNAFKLYLPKVPVLNLVEEKATDSRVYVSTYPTMMNLIDQYDGSSRMFGPGFFDLVIIDEAHRSVYAKFGAIFEWFDALLLGLTATPKDQVDHNTYRLFNLEDGVPTDAYSLAEAVADGYLVPPVGVDVGTKFLSQGIRYADLTEREKDDWDAADWGEGPPPAEIGAEELNRYLFNEDTVSQVIDYLMREGYRVDGGERLGKTIIFAKNQEHARFIEQVFNKQYPAEGGRFARVITSGERFAQQLIDDFSNPARLPQIAISVDMLDTGIDVPEVLNLVFFKKVWSPTKFWQMIGRGTRLCPGVFGVDAAEPDKQDFKVFDFCSNLEFFSTDFPEPGGAVPKSYSQRVFEARLALVLGLGGVVVGENEVTETGTAGEAHALRKAARAALREYVAGMDLDNFTVRPQRRLVERFREAEAWESLSDDDAATLAAQVAGLPSTARDADTDALRFDLAMLRAQLAAVEGDASELARAAERVRTIAVALLTLTTIAQVAAQAPLLEQVASEEWWDGVTLAELEHARESLRGLARFIDREVRASVYTDFADTPRAARLVEFAQVTPGLDVARFRTKAQAYLRGHLNRLALQRLRSNEQLTEADLAELADILVEAGGTGDEIALAATQYGGLGEFVRSLVGLEKSVVEQVLAEFIGDKVLDVNQTRFVTDLVYELTANGIMVPDRLYEQPYVNYAPTGPDPLFGTAGEAELFDLLAEFSTSLRPV